MTGSPFFFSPSVAVGITLPTPLAQWKLDEGTGTAITDSANSNGGTFVSGTWSSSGEGKGYDKCAVFDGTSSYVHTSDFFYSDVLTLSCWVYLLTVNKYNSLIHKRNVTNSINGSAIWEFGLYINTTNTLEYISYNGTGNGVSLVSSTTVGINTWYHAAVVQRGNGNTATIYIDGVNRGEYTQSGVMSNMDGYVQLGSRVVNNNARWLHGRMQDARVYNQALSDEQITYLYQST